MKINVEVDLDDFFDLVGGECLDQYIADEIKLEVLKLVKRDTRYKAFINKKATELLSNIEL